MKHIFYIITFLISFNNFGQEKFKIKQVETKSWKSIYYLVNEKGKTIKELDTAKYVISLNDDRYRYFAVFMIKGESGWSAIDRSERILFKIYNTSFGEPTPDEIIENKIRIVDENNKIGFADYKGKIIIKPQFEIATSFHKGKAIIGESCDKIPWDKHAKEEDCHHYSIVCKKHGYINDNGEILQIGDFSFEEIQKKIKWKAPEMY
ncbi:WG repeat-containing protein [Flavobacterium psychrotolerans]|uniref:WG repeat-containing protein n=1 Tax=Flavobacterium psychrotolerans TaxID=2169410 RepID=A0A2U1JKE9_9FLAO|nr:WG repeat-containing protein [Flavobacterium psychrotolerans]PWA05363.1 hypothetical protein DB895_07130 [Flavobacterium psychrotolerans]